MNERWAAWTAAFAVLRAHVLRYPSLPLLYTAYIALAACSGGSGDGSTPPPPAVKPPVASYAAAAYSYTVGVPATAVTPTASAQSGAIASWSVTPALPAGLTLNTANGTISGTPSASAATATYTVMATNSGGTLSLPLSIAVAAAPLLDLGHVNPITFISLNGTRLLSRDAGGATGHWALQDFASGSILVSGEVPCVPGPPGPIPSCADGSGIGPPYLPTAVAGPTLMVATSTGFVTYSSATGALQATVATPATVWVLASDGSYVATASSTALTVWSPTTGQTIFTHSGNYASAVIYAAPGAIQVAEGAAGNDLIETVAVPGGVSTLSPAFQGQFNTWFVDGSSFLTTQGTTLFVYSSAAAEENILTVSSLYSLGGEGHWFWTIDPLATDNLNVYPVGTGSTNTPAYSTQVAGTVVTSGTTLGLLPQAGGSVTVVDLSGAAPVATSYPVAIGFVNVYSATAASSWVVGNTYGVAMDGSQLPAQPRYLTYGEALSIAGGTGQYAIATASGSILYFDSATNAQLGTIAFPSWELSMSADGSVLAAAANYESFNNVASAPLNIYSLPSGTLVTSFPFTASQSGPTLERVSLSGSGTMLAEVIQNQNGTCTSQLIAVSGGASIWCDTTGQFTQLALSPDGTRLAASTAPSLNPFLTPSNESNTNFYLNGTLVGAVPGWAPGWIDNGHLLVNNYVQGNIDSGYDGYTGATIYDPSGNKLSSLVPPEMLSMLPVSATSVYSPALNAMISTSNGSVLWMSGDAINPTDTTLPFPQVVSAVAGSQVVFVSGSLVLTQPY
jgi:hypothetical protein